MEEAAVDGREECGGAGCGAEGEQKGSCGRSVVGVSQAAKILYSNVNGILSKIDELRTYLLVNESLNIEFICLTETHLNKYIADSELKIDGYLFRRKDRDFSIHPDIISSTVSSDIDCTSNGGGSIIYYKDHLSV